MRFAVTYNKVDKESAKEGDTCEAGFISRGSVLREAVEAFRDVRHPTGYVEANECPAIAPRWLTTYGEPEDGVDETRAIHFPDTVTASSRRRLARLLGCYGVPEDKGFPFIRA